MAVVGINSFVGCGRLVADAFNIESGKGGCKFRIAIGTYDANKTLFISCVKWGEGCKFLMPYLVKGAQVAVVGNLMPNKYKKKDGTETETVELVCNTIQLLGANMADTTPRQDKPNENINDPDYVNPSGMTNKEIEELCKNASYDSKPKGPEAWYEDDGEDIPF